MLRGAAPMPSNPNMLHDAAVSAEPDDQVAEAMKGGGGGGGGGREGRGGFLARAARSLSPATAGKAKMQAQAAGAPEVSASVAVGAAHGRALSPPVMGARSVRGGQGGDAEGGCGARGCASLLDSHMYVSYSCMYVCVL